MKTIRSLVAALFVLALAVAPSRAQEGETPPGQEPGYGTVHGTGHEAQAQAVEPQRLLQNMHVINQFEIQTAQLAQSKAQNQQVKQLAQTLAKDHQKLDKDVGKQAKKMGVQLSDVKFQGVPTEGQPQGQPGGQPGPQGQPEPQGQPGQPGQQDPMGGKQMMEMDQQQQQAKQDLQRRFLELQALSGNEFDQKFLAGQIEVHDQVIRELRAIQPQVQEKSLSQLIQKTLPVLDRHLTEAKSIQQRLQQEVGKR